MAQCRKLGFCFLLLPVVIALAPQLNRNYYKRCREDDTPLVYSRFSTKIITMFGSMYELPHSIGKYKLSMLNVEPERFLTLNHMDAHALFAVCSGQGAITTISQHKKQSFWFKPGVLFRLPANTPYYIINNSTSESLTIVQFLITVNNPGTFQPFFIAAGTTPNSYLSTFSDDIFEAALNVSYQRIEKLLRRKELDQGVFVKAKEEQIQSLMMSLDQTSGNATYNLIQKDPIFSNAYGQHYEVNSDDFPPLRYFDNLSVSLYNISKSGMITPFLDSDSTNVMFVIEGNGKLEIVCPSDGSKSNPSRERRTTVLENRVSYSQVSSVIKTGTAVVVPAGHAVVILASDRNSLQILSFKVTAENNERYFLAGKGNVVSLMDNAAKEMTFATSQENVDYAFGSQNYQFFLPGPYVYRRQNRQEENQNPEFLSTYTL